MMVEGYLNLKEEVGGSIPGSKISSLLDIILASWSIVSCVSALACWPIVSKRKRKKMWDANYFQWPLSNNMFPTGDMWRVTASSFCCTQPQRPTTSYTCQLRVGLHWGLHITLFRSKTMFCGTDNIMWNILSTRLNVWNIMQNIVSPTNQCFWIWIMLWGDQKGSITWIFG